MMLFSDLLKRLREEEGSKTLVTSLTDQDIEEIRELFSTYKERLSTANEEEKKDLERQIKNAERVLEKLLRLRIQKLLFYSSFFDLQQIENKMNKAEIIAFKSANDAIDNYIKTVFQTIKENKPKEEQKSPSKRYEVLSNISKFTWYGKSYGPYKPGDIIEIDDDQIIRILINNKQIKPI